MENVESLFKKFFYTGVGIVALTKEKLEKAINELIDQNKITEEEGKKIVDEFMDNAEKKKDEMENEMKDFVDNAISKFSFATKKDIEELLNRIEELESILAKK